MDAVTEYWLETKRFYRFIKVSHVFFIAILSLVPILISAEFFIEHNWVNALMILIIGFSASYSIPTLIKHLLIYIVYGVEIVYWNKFIATTSTIHRYIIQIFNKYPKIIYFSGIYIFYALALLIDDSFFALVGFWMLGFPLIKLIFLCKKAFIDKSYDAKDKLWDIWENTITYTILACVIAIYTIWKDPTLHYVFEAILKYIKYIWYFFGICYWIYIIWLLIKTLTNGAPKAALKILFSNLMVIALLVIIFYFYDII